MTSAHSPPTRGTMAPSTLKSPTSGPAGGAGASATSRSTSASWAATNAAPAASVSRRAVGSETSV